MAGTSGAIQYADHRDTETNCSDSKDGRRISVWSPAVLNAVADIIFFANYIIGWALTVYFQPELVWNNNVTRIFFVYNICIGVDSLPAQPVALLIYACYFLVYGAAVFVLWQLVNLKGSFFSKLVRKVILVAALGFSSTFFLTYGVRPDSPLLTKIHTWGFALGMFGYTLFHVSLLLEYFVIRKESLENKKAISYVAVVGGTIVVYLLGVGVLVHALTDTHLTPIDEWAATIDSAVFPAKIIGGLEAHKPPGPLYRNFLSAYLVVPDESGIGYHNQPISLGLRGLALVLVTAVSPFAQLCLMPNNMKLNVEFTPHVSSDTVAKEADTA
jgi:hypothetical protein